MANLETEDFITLPPNSEATTTERLHSLAHAKRFNPSVAQTVRDTGTILSLVGAASGCSVTVSFVPCNVSFTKVRFVPLDDVQGPFLRIA